MTIASDVTMGVSAERLRMVEGMFERIDRSDAHALDPYLTADATLIFGNQPPLVGLEAIHEGNAAFFSAIGGLGHEIVGLWELDQVVIVRLRVTYTRLDGGQVQVPVVTIFEEQDGRITHYQVYFDLAPVFADA